MLFRSYYNSFSGVPYFLKGIENVGYVYNEHVDGDLSIVGIKAYCEAHPLENEKKSDNDVSKKKSKNEDDGDEYKPF